MDNRYRGRKWKAFKWILAVQIAGTVSGYVKIMLSNDPAIIGTMTGFIISCFTAIASTLGFYFAVNAVQKNIEAKKAESKVNE